MSKNILRMLHVQQYFPYVEMKSDIIVCAIFVHGGLLISSVHLVGDGLAKDACYPLTLIPPISTRSLMETARISGSKLFYV